MLICSLHTMAEAQDMIIWWCPTKWLWTLLQAIQVMLQLTVYASESWSSELSNVAQSGLGPHHWSTWNRTTHPILDHWYLCHDWEWLTCTEDFINWVANKTQYNWEFSLTWNITWFHWNNIDYLQLLKDLSLL